MTARYDRVPSIESSAEENQQVYWESDVTGALCGSLLPVKPCPRSAPVRARRDQTRTRLDERQSLELAIMPTIGVSRLAFHGRWLRFVPTGTAPMRLGTAPLSLAPP
jgi:hypothetical protein